MKDLLIRKLTIPEEMEAVEEIQSQIWPGSPVDIVPGHMMLAAIHNGGLVLGAFIEGRLIGFLFGFPGISKYQEGNRLKHCSHMLGIRPEWRDAGIGFALKVVQRDTVRKQGINLITWTYDPLLSRNAYLNINKLGGVCRTYLRSVYGSMRDGLNTELESDRFQVDWWLDSSRVVDRLDNQAAERRNLEEISKMDLEILAIGEDEKPMLSQPTFDYQLLLVEIPMDFLALKSRDIYLAKEWRSTSRVIFENAFSKGFLIKGFIKEAGHSYYLLDRD